MGNVYIDFNASTGTLTGTWTFTNGAGMTAAGDGDAVNELANGDYVRQSDGTQWYKVTARPAADTITLSPVFQQATHTDDVGASLYNDTSVSGALFTDYVHLHQATKDTVRVAGDNVFVRANQTHTHAGDALGQDEFGSVDDYITIIGADSIIDPWGDGSNVKPIFDWASLATAGLAIRAGWAIKSLDFTGATDHIVTINGQENILIQNCSIHGVVGTDTGVQVLDSGNVVIENCDFYDNRVISVSLSRGLVSIKGCVFNGGPNATNFGVYVIGGIAIITDSTFGVTTEHANGDIRLARSGVGYGRNVLLNSTTQVVFVQRANNFFSAEDDGQVHEAYKLHHGRGEVTRSTAIERSGEGGTDWSMLVEPNSNCGLQQALHGFPFPPRGIPVYLDGTEQTITIHAYATSWAALPSVSEFVMEIEHFEGAGDWEIDTSSDTFAANDQWESFSITLTPGAEGPAYLRVKLLDFEDGTEKIYVDPTPVFS